MKRNRVSFHHQRHFLKHIELCIGTFRLWGNIGQKFYNRYISPLITMGFKFWIFKSLSVSIIFLIIKVLLLSDPLDTDKALIPSIFIKTSQFFYFFGESWHQSSFSKIVVNFFFSENGHPFFGRHIIEKKSVQFRPNIIRAGSKSWLLTCSSNITLTLSSYTGSALKRELNFCNRYLSLL